MPLDQNDRAEKLIFVYNANSGLANSILGGVHKLFSPATYACNLCSITYGALFEHTVWKKFREEASVSMEFLHKDEFIKLYGPKQPFSFPIILSEVQGELHVFISTERLDQITDARALVGLINARLL